LETELMKFPELEDLLWKEDLFFSATVLHTEMTSISSCKLWSWPPCCDKLFQNEVETFRTWKFEAANNTISKI